MYVTATLETRKALTSKWEGLERLYERYHELNGRDSYELSPQQKRDLEKLREDICHQEFDRVESPALRIRKFVHLGDNSKRFECDALADVSRRSAHKLEELVARFQPPSNVPGEIQFSLKLQDRMIINHTGGVLENAGICLHPHAGVPYIPGSAVKGVTRHAAWTLWAEAMDEDQADDAKEIALKTALTFGFPTNDEALDDYCQETWPEWFGKGAPYETLAGLFAFMQAMPMQNMALVTDIVNGHHSKYYQGKQTTPVGNERPNPQFFPAVEKGALFTFTIYPLRRAEVILVAMAGGLSMKELCLFAESSLRMAAEDFGFGSKTSNGYGWFAEDRLAEAALSERAAMEERLAKEKEEREQKQAEEEQRRKEKKAREQELSQLTPAERATEEICSWNDGKWTSVLGSMKELNRLSDEQKSTLITQLASTEQARWLELKHKAQTGKKKEKKNALPIRDEIYRLAKQQTPKVKMP